jgi:putative selenate reductase
VIGGGNTAMDAARTAKRLTGGDVTVVYRRTRQEMPATEEEIEGLLAEGIALEELASPVRVVLADGRAAALTCIRNRLGEPDASGRRRPTPVGGSAFDLPADAVIVAVGQAPDLAFLDGSAVTLRKNGTVATCPAGVYAGGDVVRGPAIIIEACADGRQAAEAICRQLDIPCARPGVALPVLSEAEIAAVKTVRARRIAAHHPAMRPPAARAGFDLVEAALTEAAARAEAARCVQCATFCDKCVEVCPNRANYAVVVTPRAWAVPALACRDGQLVVVSETPFVVTQGRQIVHVDDLCNECGNCATFCIHEGKPYREKPRLFLEREGFEQEADNAFYVEAGADSDGMVLHRRENGQSFRLSVGGDGAYEYEDNQLRTRLSADFQVETLELKTPFDGTVSLVTAAEMAVALEGVIGSLRFLPLGQ